MISLSRSAHSSVRFFLWKRCSSEGSESSNRLGTSAFCTESNVESFYKLLEVLVSLLTLELPLHSLLIHLLLLLSSLQLFLEVFNSLTMFSCFLVFKLLNHSLCYYLLNQVSQLRSETVRKLLTLLLTKKTVDIFAFSHNVKNL